MAREGVVARPWRRGALVCLFFIAATAFFTYPLIFELPTALLTGLGDYLGESSLIAWNARQVLRSPAHLFDAPFYYPYSKTTAFGQSLLFPGLLAVPGLALTGQPMLVSNVLLFLSIALSGALTFGLAFALTGQVLPSALAGVVFAYFPNRMDHLGQFTYQMSCLYPLVFWGLWRFLESGGRLALAIVVAGLWAQALSSLYNAYALGLLLIGFVAAFVVLRPGALGWRLLGRGALGLIVLALLLAPFLEPYLDLHRELGFERDVALGEVFGMDLLSILDPGVFNVPYRRSLLHLNRAEGGMFPGFVALGLAGVAVALTFRRGAGADRSEWVTRARVALTLASAGCVIAAALVAWRGGIRLHVRPFSVFHVSDLTLVVNAFVPIALAWVALEARSARTGPLKSRQWASLLLFLAVLAYMLTQTPTLTIATRPVGSTSLFRWAFFHLPGANAFRAPGRWSSIFFLPVALLAALGLTAVARRLSGPLRIGLPLLLLAIAMGEYVTLPIPWDHLPPSTPVYRWLSVEPGDFAALELPIYAGGADARYMFRQTEHWKRLVNGAIGFVPDSVNEIVDASEPFDGAAFMDVIRSIYPLRYVIAHTATMEAAERTRWLAMRSAPLPGLRPVERFDADDVYAVTPTPQRGIEVRRTFSTDLARQRPHVAYEVRFSGDDPEVRRWVDVSFNGRPLAHLERGGAGMLLLAPPFKAADRNELRFRHDYAVLPDVARTESYRIGRTGATSPFDLEAVSGGRDHGQVVSIKVDGHEMVMLPRRGYYVIALDPLGRRLLVSDNFDTFAAARESRRMARAIDGVPDGTIVVAAVKTDGGGQLEAEGVRALHSVGAQADTRGTLWQSHLVLGVKGARPGEAIEAVGARELSARVGRERPLELSLEAFELR